MTSHLSVYHVTGGVEKMTRGTIMVVFSRMFNASQSYICHLLVVESYDIGILYFSWVSMMGILQELPQSYICHLCNYDISYLVIFEDNLSLSVKYPRMRPKFLEQPCNSFKRAYEGHHQATGPRLLEARILSKNPHILITVWNLTCQN